MKLFYVALYPENGQVMNQTPIRILSILCLFFLFSQSLSGQNKHTINGYIRDAASGEDLSGAKIIVSELGTGTYSNEYGFYSLTLPEGTYTFVFRYLSYLDDTVVVELTKNVAQNIDLAAEAVNVGVVEITDKKEDQNVKDLEMSVATIQVEDVRKLPAFLGEVDVIRTIQLLPGVQGAGEGLTGYYVRGGLGSHNLILLDEATVFNASHLLGIFSVFNSDALKDDYKLYKGGIPAKYSGRLASVLDLRMKEGNAKQFKVTGGIGSISSRATIEGPIAKDKASFVLSGRRSYPDIFLNFSKDEAIKNTTLYFYDVNAKVNYRISDKDRIFASGYLGRDVLGFRGFFGNDWGNATATVRWNHLFSDRLFANTTLIYSDFDYGIDGNTFGGDGFTYKSGIRDMSFKTDFTWFATPEVKMNFGYSGTFHKFKPGFFQPTDSSFLQDFSIDPDFALEHALYVSNEHKISDRLSMEYGLAYSIFDNIGPGEEYTYLEDRVTIEDTTQFNDGQLINRYHGFEPRASMRYILDENSSVKASYNRMRQYLHLASNSAASFPWDIWVPSSRHIPPQIADQVAVGYFRNFWDNKLETSVELYYKDMKNQVDFKNDAQLLLNPTLETEFLFGNGTSYGAEFLIRKNRGKLRGWVGYTLAKTTRQIEGINDGEPYSAFNDRRHDISVVGIWQFKPRLSLSGTWIFATGNAITFPVGRYIYDGQVVNFYGDRNSARLPANHRMDLSLNIDPKKREETKKKRRLTSSWNISLYNVYGRRNVWAIDFREDDDGNNVAVKLYLGRWIPSVTWNFEF